jgi:hypothetical protein
MIGSYLQKGCVLAAQSLLLWVGGPLDSSGMQVNDAVIG